MRRGHVAEARAPGACAGVSRSLRAVGTFDVDVTIAATPGHPHPPGIAADFAILDEAALHIRLHVNLHLLAAIRARD